MAGEREEVGVGASTRGRLCLGHVFLTSLTRNGQMIQCASRRHEMLRFKDCQCIIYVLFTRHLL